MSRDQANAFLSPSLQQPHMTLSADLTYIEGHQQGPTNLSMETTEPLEMHIAPTTGEIVIPPSPSTSRPLPRSLPAHDYVPLWSSIFHPNQEKDEKGKAREGSGRVWVGRTSNERWTAVYEFKGDVAFVRSSFTKPKLSVVVTVTFKDDPKLDDLVMGASYSTATNLDDEYLVESFDDVNLFDESLGLHLPASRLPLPTKSTAKTTVQRMSRRSISLTGADIVFPTIRRAFRRVVNVESGVNVRMRLVPCPISAATASSSDHDDSMAMSVVMDVERAAFDVDSVHVDVSGGASPDDIQVTPVLHDQFPVRLEPNDRYNLIYALAYTGQDVPAVTNESDPTFPLQVVESPSTRFTSRMEAGGSFEGSLSRPKVSPWLRNVTISVKGRPRLRNGAYPTRTYESKWKSVIDIQPSVAAANVRHPIPISAPKPVELSENVAGNPKFTVSGLADLAQRSPNLSRRAQDKRPFARPLPRPQSNGTSLQESASMARSASQTQRQSYTNSTALPYSMPSASIQGNVVVTITVQSLRAQINLLDVFLVQVFVLNKGDTVRRFRVGVPDPAAREANDEALVALENEVRIGPLVPQSCHSVRIRFLAIRPGTHTLSELSLLDVATGKVTKLRNPVQVVVV